MALILLGLQGAMSAFVEVQILRELREVLQGPIGWVQKKLVRKTNATPGCSLQRVRRVKKGKGMGGIVN